MARLCMKKLLMIPLLALLMMVVAPIAFANNNDNGGGVRVGFWAGVFGRSHWDENDWPCYHPGWGRWFARGWMKNHSGDCQNMNDTNNPDITGVSVSSITRTSAIVNVSADEPVSVVVEYGTSFEYGTSAKESDYARSQNVALLNLASGTRYHYRVTMRDAAGNATRSDDRTFMTDHGSGNNNENDAPKISAMEVSAITTTSAVISWNTDENASGVVEYGTTIDYGSSAAATAMRMNHSVTLRNLKPDTMYHYHIVARDAHGNRKVSDDRTFRTDKGDVTAPVISNTSIVNVTDQSVRITWNTDERATSRIYYGSLLPITIGTARVAANSDLVTNHSITLTGLDTNTSYYFILESVDAAGNVRTSGEMTFVTK